MKFAILLGMALGFGAICAAPASADECYTVAACVLGANLGSTFQQGAGVEGQTYNGYGVLGFSTNYVGVYGYSGNSFGVAGVTGGATTPGVYGNAFGTSTTAIGVEGLAAYGFGGVFTSTSGTGLFASSQQGSAILAASGGGSSPIVALEDDVNVGNPADFLVGGNSPYCNICFTLDASGNLTLAGGLTQNGTPQIRTHTTGGDVTTYGARSASPTLEDTGTAKLTSGVSFVALDKAFASTIAPGYEVFVTPHGDSNGLYTQATAGGFTVRENRGGRSTMTFDYRIVAKPLDAKGTRLATMAPIKREASVVRPMARPVMHHLSIPHSAVSR